MNKIYNNLNADNLMKTEMFNQFNKEQKKQIKSGIEKGLDVSWYAKKEFDVPQMIQIKMGLLAN